MAQTTIDRDLLKQTLKEALAETLHEEREFLHDVFAEVHWLGTHLQVIRPEQRGRANFI